MSYQLWALPTMCPACHHNTTTLHTPATTAYCANQTSVGTEGVRND